MNSYCSQYLIERTINDGIRDAAACQARLSQRDSLRYDDKKDQYFLANHYVTLTIDPLEDPKKIIVDVNVKMSHFDYLDQLTNNLKRISIDTPPTDVFTQRQDHEDVYWSTDRACGFSRRLTLHMLATLVLDVMQNKTYILFDTPVMSNVSDLENMENRKMFDSNSINNWFKKIDTYSKCITLVELYRRCLALEGAPITLEIVDMYCAVFTQVHNRIYISHVKEEERKKKSVDVTSDLSLLYCNNLHRNFLNFYVDSSSVSHSYNDSSQILSDLNALASLDADLFHKDHCKRVKLSNNKDNEQHKVVTMTYLDGYKSNLGYAELAPYSVKYRELPLAKAKIYNPISFPVCVNEKLRFYMKLKKSVSLFLFASGLFRFPGQFKSGLCPLMNRLDCHVVTAPTTDTCATNAALPSTLPPSSSPWMAFQLANYSPIDNLASRNGTLTFSNSLTNMNNFKLSMQEQSC